MLEDGSGLSPAVATRSCCVCPCAATCVPPILRLPLLNLTSLAGPRTFSCTLPRRFNSVPEVQVLTVSATTQPHVKTFRYLYGSGTDNVVRVAVSASDAASFQNKSIGEGPARPVFAHFAATHRAYRSDTSVPATQ